MSETNDDLVNVSLTLKRSQVKYLEKKSKKLDLKRSQIVRALIDKDMATDKVKS